MSMTRREALEKMKELLAARGHPSIAYHYILICLEALELIKFEGPDEAEHG